MLGVAFGLLFPLLATALVCFEEGCNDGVIGLHLRSRLMQIIDLAPIVLGIVAYFLGVSVDRRLKAEYEAQLAISMQVEVERELADKLRERNVELLELNRTLDGLVYTASHDLKTPVINFKSMIKMLKMVKDKPDSGKMVDEIIVRMESATERFQSTIHDLLEVSRIERQDEAPKQAVPLKACIQGIMEGLETYFEEKNAKLVLDFEEVEVEGDMASVTSIFQNLLTNAVKYHHPDRPPLVRLSTEQTDKHVVIHVADNGLGIDLKTQRSKVFKMFTRLHNTSEGTGIGLYIVKRTVVKLGGDIDLVSEAGLGTTFTVKLKRWKKQ
jgi:signal transduction histidine kinase